MAAFVTVMMMPLTYSIAYGLIGGTLVYAVMEGTFWILNKAGVAMPAYEEDEEDDADASKAEELKESAKEDPEGEAKAVSEGGKDVDESA